MAEQEKHHEQGALDFYTDSAGLFYQAWKGATDKAIKDALEQRLSDAVSRAEDLKGVSLNTVPLLSKSSESTETAPQYTAKMRRVIMDIDQDFTQLCSCDIVKQRSNLVQLPLSLDRRT